MSRLRHYKTAVFNGALLLLFLPFSMKISMKKQFLLLALLGGTTTAAQAQNAIAAGTVALGGGIGYSRTTEKENFKFGSNAVTRETVISTFSFTPSVGYFVADNLALGLGIEYIAQGKPYTKLTPTPTTVPSELDPTTTIRVGPYVQYYKMVSDQFGVVGTLGLGFQSTREQDYGNGRNGVVQEL